MSKVNETLQKRGEVYGNFRQGIKLESVIMQNVKGRYYAENGHDMPEWYAVALSKIVMKISRLSVTPDHIDSWHDIAGYAVLVEQHLKENTNA